MPRIWWEIHLSDRLGRPLGIGFCRPERDSIDYAASSWAEIDDDHPALDRLRELTDENGWWEPDRPPGSWRYPDPRAEALLKELRRPPEQDQ